MLGGESHVWRRSMSELFGTPNADYISKGKAEIEVQFQLLNI